VNLLLLAAGELDADARVRLTGRRARHLIDVLGVDEGSTVRAGVVGRAPGEATVVRVEPDAVVLDGSSLPAGPAAPSALAHVSLTLALPRPKALRRTLRSLATFGVGRVDLTNAWRVEKSYFQSPAVEPEEIRRELVLGAEQGMTTRLPEVSVHRFLMSWFDGLGDPATEETRLLAHPHGAPLVEDVLPAASEGPVRLALGPEGGWTEREIETFERFGFSRVALGPWVLTTREAVVAALAQVALVHRLASRGRRQPT
jgi:RsmE family RNA methyltransferase